MAGKRGTQQTLFQTWEKKNPDMNRLSNSNPTSGGASISKNIKSENRKVFSSNKVDEMIDLTDDDLLVAAEAFESSLNNQDVAGPSGALVEHIPGFDTSLGHIWIYPTNYPVRDYQLSIVRCALFQNTLVSLPTGLGKTFIAAVVMYNFYRWYPEGKVVFMAPTKPLVSQQIDACYKIMGISMEDQAEITGMNTPVHKRAALWTSKRVFFLTPQVINNDLARNVCPASEIKCIVIDEAHKALGKHAYCQVIQQLVACSSDFRVLALSATPGSDTKSVQQVVTNLLISHIEMRAEDSIDIQQYSHQRSVEKIVCKLDERMLKMKENFLKVIETFIRNLVRRNALYDTDVSRYSKYGILLARDNFRKNHPDGMNKYELGSIEGDFATTISLYHGLDLLLQHGMRSFFIFIKGIMEGGKGSMRAKTVLGGNITFRAIYEELTNMYGHSPESIVHLTQDGRSQRSSRKTEPSDSDSYIYSHPKMMKLEEVVLNHFQTFAKESETGNTRVMVFCQYRDSVQEITELLQHNRPLLRPMQFVGHSTASGKMAKFTQKDQLQVVEKFRTGGYNILVSTCVGEEGLDIGDVDLIVCFDAHKSPIRLVQRMGRTGRKRKGKIVMLVTEGKEERDYNASVSNKKSINKVMTGSSGRSLNFYPHSPRMIPKGLNPTVHKMFITVKPYTKSGSSKTSKPAKKKPSQSADISVMISKASKASEKDSIFLTSSQCQEWDGKLKLSSKEKKETMHLPPVGRMHCLKHYQKNSTEERKTLSLSEWALWQSRLQTSHLSGHSTTTEHFVELMEVCDVIKQADEKTFDMSLAPFLGGNYDKTDKQNRDKIDSLLIRKAKQTKLLKSEIASKLSSPVVNSSSEADFVPKLGKKLLQKSSYKERLSDFAILTETSSKPDCNDNTLADVDSVLFDETDDISAANFELKEVKKNPQLSPVKNYIIDSDENLDNVAFCINAPKSAGKAENTNQSTRQSKILKKKKFKIRHTEKRRWGDDDTDTRILSDAEEAKIPVESAATIPASNEDNLFDPPPVLDDASKHSPTGNEVQKPISPLPRASSKDHAHSSGLGISDDLSVLATPMDNSNKPYTSAAQSPGLQIPTPPSFDSESLDFLDDFANPLSDDDDDDEKQGKKPLSKAHFALGNDKIKQSKVIGEADNIFNPGTLGTLSMADDSITLLAKTEMEVNGRVEVEDFSSKENSKLASDKENSKFNFHDTAHQALEFQNTSRNSTGSAAVSDIRGNHTTNTTCKQKSDGKKEQKNTDIMDISADLFDVNFDFGDEICSPEKEENAMTSPVLLPKSMTKKMSSSVCKTSEVPSVKKKLASVMLSQRSENRALFADWPDTEADIPVAEVKPTKSNSFTREGDYETATEIGLNTKRTPSSEINFSHVDLFGDTPSSELQMRDSLKRKRNKDCNHGDNSFQLFKRKRDNSPNHIEADLGSQNVNDGDIPTPNFNFGNSSDDSSEGSPVAAKRNCMKNLLSSPHVSCRNEIGDSDDEDILLSQLPFKNLQASVGRDSLLSRASLVRSANLHKRNGSAVNRQSTPRTRTDDVVSDDDFTNTCERPAKSMAENFKHQIRKIMPNRKSRAACLRDFVDDEAEVSIDAHVSSDECEADDTAAALEEMKDFVNDSSMLTQHVQQDASAVDEQAMYLRAGFSPRDKSSGLFKNPSKFQANNGKFKLAYGIGKDVDVFSQEVPEDVSGYEENSFVVDEEDDDEIDMSVLGDVTVLEDVSHSKTRTTRRQAQLKEIKKLDYDNGKEEKDFSKESKSKRKRIVCFDESTDSVESENIPGERDSVAVKTSEDWNCPACTLLNPTSSPICQLCDTEKPFDNKSKDVQMLKEWICQQCTFINKGSNTVCEICGSFDSPNYTEKCKQTKLIAGNMKSQLKPGMSTSKISSIPRPHDKGGLEIPSLAKLKQDMKNQTPSGSQASNSSYSEERDERLRRSRLKQMEFKANMEQKKMWKMSTPKEITSASRLDSKMSSTPNESPVQKSVKASLQFESPIPHVCGSILKNDSGRSSDKLVIVVDSKELSSGQQIVTLLKSKHNIHVVVASSTHCDYIVGRGTVVERKLMSELGNVMKRQKLIARIQELHSHHDRVYLLVEQDRTKRNDLGSGRSQIHSDYYISTVCYLTQANVRILHSDSEEDSAAILQMLAERESGLKRSIEVNVAKQANDHKLRSLIQAYSSIPKISFLSALYLCHNFKSFREVALSSVEKLMKKAYITTAAAAEVYSFFRREFDKQM